MPAPRWLARVNRYITNPLLSPLARRLPGWGIVHHISRTTHRHYRTPVAVFRRDGGFVIALTYGRESQWVRNVIAQGGCKLETRKRILTLTHPNLFHDETRHAMPSFVRMMLGILNVSDFLELTIAN